MKPILTPLILSTDCDLNKAAFDVAVQVKKRAQKNSVTCSGYKAMKYQGWA